MNDSMFTIFTSYRLPVTDYQSQRGFTLVEIVLATGIFVVLIAVMIGIFSQFTSTQRRDIAEQKLLEEIRHALELFNREARTGYGSTYALTDGSGQSVAFRNQNGLCVNYRLEGAQLMRAEREVSGQACDADDFAGVTYTPLTSADISIDQLRFDVTASTSEAEQLDRQGFITLILRISSDNESVPATPVQSTVTSRQVAPFQGV
jgi:prepilin-type N-terminal cleavage/methylation domain-containing protein